MTNPQSIMSSMFSKIALDLNMISFSEIEPILVEQDEQSKEIRAAANKKLQQELEEMEKQLKSMKEDFKLDGAKIDVYPNKSNLLEDYINYSTLQSKIIATKNALRIRLLPLQDRIKETGVIMGSIKDEEETGQAMEQMFNMLSNGNRMDKIVKEIEDERKEKGDIEDKPTFSRRLNKKEPKLEVSVTKTDKKAVFSLSFQDPYDGKDIPEADEEEIPFSDMEAVVKQLLILDPYNMNKKKPDN